MASDVPTMGAPSRASDFPNTPSRRGLFMMAAATAFAGSAAVQATPGLARQGANAMNMQTSIRSEGLANQARANWDRAIRAHERAQKAYDDFEPTVFAAFEAYRRASPNPEAIAWDGLGDPFGDKHDWLTRADLDERTRFFLEGEGKWWFARNPEGRKAKFHATIEQIRDYRRRDEQADRESGRTAAIEEENRRSSRVFQAWTSLIQMPAPDHAALMWKLEQLFGDVGSDESETVEWQGKYLSQLMADARRLLTAD